jgi:hypothetical protein
MTPEGSPCVRSGVVEEIFENLEPNLHGRFSGWMRSALGPEQDSHPRASGFTSKLEAKASSKRKEFSVLVPWSYCLLQEHRNEHQLFRGDEHHVQRLSALTGSYRAPTHERSRLRMFLHATRQTSLSSRKWEGPYHALRDSSIEIYALDDESNTARVLDAFSRKELRSIPHREEPR